MVATSMTRCACSLVAHASSAACARIRLAMSHSTNAGGRKITPAATTSTILVPFATLDRREGRISTAATIQIAGITWARVWSQLTCSEVTRSSSQGVYPPPGFGTLMKRCHQREAFRVKAGSGVPGFSSVPA